MTPTPENYQPIQIPKETHGIVKELAKEYNTTMIDIITRMVDQFHPLEAKLKKVVHEFLITDLFDFGYTSSEEPGDWDAASKCLVAQILEIL